MGESRNIDGLDVLRGVAICGVIFAHFFGAYIPKIVEEISANGGVILFFLLSGFLIDLTFSKDQDILRYAVRRGTRILPMYWIAVLLIAFTSDKWILKDVAANLIFVPDFHNQMSGVFWTLYVECLFYVLAPLTVLSGTVGIVAAPLLVVARFSYGSALDWPANPLWFFMSYCFIGLQFGAAARGVLNPLIPIATTVVVAAAASFVSVGTFLGPLSVACVLAFYFCLTTNPANAVLRYLGRVSYSWYLLHSIFGYTIGWKAVSYLHLPAPIGLFIGALSMLALSAITHRFIELPGISIGKLILRRRAIAPA
jgi:peptidoglycan/LPS O-acetylase OafA/YrhL